MGKRTTTRHKADNTFRFESAPAKLRKLHIRQLEFRDVDSGSGSEVENTYTYFCECLKTNSEKNNSEDFLQLVDKLLPVSKSLEQILHEKEFIVTTLLTQLDNVDLANTFKEATELSVALAQDIKTEFEGHLPALVKVVRKVVLDSKEPDIVHAGFNCLGRHFKILRKHVILHYKRYLKLIAPLWSSSLQSYMSQLASEAFTSISLKSWNADKELFFSRLLKYGLKEHPDSVSGVATLLFEMMRGVGGENIFSGALIFKTSLSLLKQSNEEDGQLWKLMTKELIVKVKNNFSENLMLELTKILEDFLDTLPECRAMGEDISTICPNSKTCIYFLELYKSLIEVDETDSHLNSKFTSHSFGTDTQIDRITRFINLQNFKDFEFQDAMLNILGLASQIQSESFITCATQFMQMCDIKVLRQFELIIMERGVDDIRFIRQFVRSYSTRFTENELRTHGVIGEDCDYFNKLKEAVSLRCMSDLIMRRPLRMPFHPLRDDLPKIPMADICDVNSCCDLTSIIHDGIQNRSTDRAHLELLVRYCIVYACFSGWCLKCEQKRQLVEVCNQLILDLSNVENLSEQKNSHEFLTVIYYLLLTCLEEYDESLENLNLERLIQHLGPRVTFGKSGFSIWALKIWDNLLIFKSKCDRSSRDNSDRFVAFRKRLHQLFFDARFCVCQDKSIYWGILIPNLRCGYRTVRALTSSVIFNWRRETTNGFEELINNSRALDLQNPFLPDFTTTVAKYLMDLGNNLHERPQEFEFAFNYVFGLLYTNNKNIWESCTKFLKMALPRYQEVNSNFGNTVLEMISATSIENLLKATDRNSSDFPDIVEISNFALPNWDMGNAQVEERLDPVKYVANIFLAAESLSSQPGFMTKAFEDALFCIQRAKVEIQKCEFSDLCISSCHPLSSYIAFLSTCQLSQDDSAKLYDSVIDFLMIGKLSDLVLDLLLVLKPTELKPYQSEIKEVGQKKNNTILQKFAMECQDPLVLIKHRECVIPIIIRMILLKIRYAKSNARKSLLKYVASFSENEIMCFLDLAVGEQLFRVTQKPRFWYKKLRLIDAFLETLRYRYPRLVDILIRKTCSIVAALQPQEPASDNEAINDPFHQQQVKKAVDKARDSITHFFEWLPKHDFKCELLEGIFCHIIWPALDREIDPDSIMIDWMLKLFKIWSKNKRYHILLSKLSTRKSVSSKISPMTYLFQALSSKTSIAVRAFVLDIVVNLMSGADLEEVEGIPIEVENCEFSNDDNTGLNIILAGTESLTSSLRNQKLFKRFCRNGGPKRFLLIEELAKRHDDASWNKELCGLLVQALAYYKDDEENLYLCLEAVQRTFSNVQDEEHLLISLGSCFLTFTGRRLRTALCRILDASTEQFTTVREIINGLNSWQATADDSVDYVARQVACSKCKEVLSEKFNRVLFTLVASHCFYILNQVSELSEQNMALEILECISKYTPDSSEKLLLKNFVGSTILKNVLSGLSLPDERKAHIFLQVLKVFIEHGQDLHEILGQLKYLTPDILDGLCDIKINMRTRSMNKLNEVLVRSNLSPESIRPESLQKYVLPLAMRNLYNEEMLHDNRNELVDSSIQVISTVCKILPYECYLRIFKDIVDKVVDEKRLMKQHEKVIMAIIGGFHFNLNAAFENEDVADLSNGTAVFDNELIDHFEKLNSVSSEKCFEDIMKKIVPQLQKKFKFNEKTFHKLAITSGSDYDNQTEQNISCASSLVKLLKLLPQKGRVIDIIRPILPTFCAHMRTKNHLSRKMIRQGLASLLKELGSSYFSSLVHSLVAVLKRGYERHVLIYTISYLMKSCEDVLKADVRCIPVKIILQICQDELFGEMESEKDVEEIKAKTPEARGDNAGQILEHLASLVNDIQILDRLVSIPLEVLQSGECSHKTMKHAAHWLQTVHQGLLKNKNLDLVDVLKLLKSKLEIKSPVVTLPKKKKFKTPTYEIPVLIKNGKVSKSNNTLLSEFVYNIFLSALKSNKITGLDLRNDDEFILRLFHELGGSSVKMEILAMKCLAILLRRGIFECNDRVNDAWRKVLSKMSEKCRTSEIDQELVAAIFKFLTSYLETFSEHLITVSEFDLMMTSIHCVLEKENISVSAIHFLKRVIASKSDSKSRLQDIIEVVKTLSIESGHGHVREGCRLVCSEYFRNYCTTLTQCKEFIQFFMDNLKLPDRSARLSAAVVLKELILLLPKQVHQKCINFIFVKLVLEIDHNKSEDVVSKLCEILEVVVKIESTRELIIEQTSALMSTIDAEKCFTYALVAGHVLKTWHQRLSLKQLAKFAACYEQILTESLWASAQLDDHEISLKDSAIIVVLEDLVKVFKQYFSSDKCWNPIGRLESIFDGVIATLRSKCLNQLNHQILAKTYELLHIILSSISVDLAIDGMKPRKNKYCTIIGDKSDLNLIIRKIAGTVVKNLVMEEQIDLVIKNLEILTKLVVQLFNSGDKGPLDTCMKYAVYLICSEVVQSPQQYHGRRMAYHICSVFIECSSSVSDNLKVEEEIIYHCCRDTSDQNSPVEVTRDSNELLRKIKTKIGYEAFTRLEAKALNRIGNKRQENRAKKSENVVLHGVKRKRKATTSEKNKKNAPGTKNKKRRKK